MQGELQVTLVEARALPVWGFPWTSNPWCRLQLGSQAENSRRDDDTSHAGRHRHPVWNQEWTLLVRPRPPPTHSPTRSDDVEQAVVYST